MGFFNYIHQKSTGKKAGSVAYHTGKCDWSAGIHSGSVFDKGAEFFQNDVVRVLPYQCISEVLARNLIRMFLRNIRKKGLNQKHMILVGVQPCG